MMLHDTDEPFLVQEMEVLKSALTTPEMFSWLRADLFPGRDDSGSISSSISIRCKKLEGDTCQIVISSQHGGLERSGAEDVFEGGFGEVVSRPILLAELKALIAQIDLEYKLTVQLKGKVTTYSTRPGQYYFLFPNFPCCSEALEFIGKLGLRDKILLSTMCEQFRILSATSSRQFCVLINDPAVKSINVRCAEFDDCDDLGVAIAIARQAITCNGTHQLLGALANRIQGTACSGDRFDQLIALFQSVPKSDHYFQECQAAIFDLLMQKEGNFEEKLRLAHLSWKVDPLVLNSLFNQFSGQPIASNVPLDLRKLTITEVFALGGSFREKNEAMQAQNRELVALRADLEALRASQQPGDTSVNAARFLR